MTFPEWALRRDGGCQVCHRPHVASVSLNATPGIYINVSAEVFHGPCEPTRDTFMELKVCGDCRSRVMKMINTLFVRLKSSPDRKINR